MLCLIGVALATLQGLPEDVAEGMAKERRGYEALGRETANIKAIQDKTRAQLAEMAKSDFFGPGQVGDGQGAGIPSSFAQLPPAMGDSAAKLAKIEAQVKASMDKLDSSLTDQEARARAKATASSLLEAMAWLKEPQNARLADQARSRAKTSSLLEFDVPTLDAKLKVHQHAPYEKSAKLLAEDQDVLKVQAIADELKKRSEASHDKFEEDMRRELQPDAAEAPASLSQHAAQEVKAEDDPDADEEEADAPEDADADADADAGADADAPDSDPDSELGDAGSDPDSLLQLRQSHAPVDPALERIHEKTHRDFELRKQELERRRTNDAEAMQANKARVVELKAKLKHDHEKASADHAESEKKEQAQMRKVKAAENKWKALKAQQQAAADPE